MADTMNLKFLDLAGLQAYDAKLKGYVDGKDALSLKGLALSEDGKKLLAFKDLPIEGATAAYEIELPETDISGLLEKFNAATAGNVVTVAADGKTIVDSGVAMSDVATKSEVTEVKTKAEALEALVGVIPEGYEAQTIVAYIKEVADAIIANGYDDTELKARVKANEEALGLLNGAVTVEGSVDYKVAQEIAKIVADAPESLNDLKEIATWISTHETDAAGMNLAIQSNKTAIEALDAFVGELPEGATATTVVGYIAEVLEDADLAQYAKASDLAAAVERIAANEQAINAINASLAEGGATYNQIAEAKKAGTDAQAAVDNLAAYVGTFTAVNGEETVVAYIDAKVAKVTADIEARLAAVEAKADANEAAIAAINDEATGILAKSKEYTDALANGQVKTNTEAIAQNTEDIAAVTETVDSIGAIDVADIEALF